MSRVVIKSKEDVIELSQLSDHHIIILNCGGILRKLIRIESSYIWQDLNSTGDGVVFRFDSIESAVKTMDGKWGNKVHAFDSMRDFTLFLQAHYLPRLDQKKYKSARCVECGKCKDRQYLYVPDSKNPICHKCYHNTTSHVEYN